MLVSGGEHYETHLLKNVKSYDNSRVVGVYGKGPLNDLNISDSTMAAVTKGMHDLTYDSLRSAFSRCVVEAGAKTGSAQVGTDIANGTFVAYAPYDDPEIAIAIVVEKGGQCGRGHHQRLVHPGRHRRHRRRRGRADAVNLL